VRSKEGEQAYGCSPYLLFTFYFFLFTFYFLLFLAGIAKNPTIPGARADTRALLPRDHNPGAAKERREDPVGMSFDTVIRDDGLTPTLACNADEGLIVSRHVEVVIVDIGVVLGAGVRVINDHNAVFIEVCLGLGTIGEQPVVESLNSLCEARDHLGIRLDKPPLSILA